jgi:hypothetical protein
VTLQSGTFLASARYRQHRDAWWKLLPEQGDMHDDQDGDPEERKQYDTIHCSVPWLSRREITEG